MLTEPDDMDTYILALAEDSLISAWQYQRTFPDESEIRTRLARKVLVWCFSRELHSFYVLDPSDSITVAKPRPEHLKQLISFPLSPFEQSLLHNFALDPPISFPTSSIPVLQDLVCVRLIQLGQYVEALKLDREYASTQRGTQAPQVADRRRKMIEDVIAALPSIERLEIEEKLRAVPQHKLDAPKPSQTKTPADLTMSWEEIPLPPRITSTTSGAPKFVLGRNTHGNIQQKAAPVPGPAKEVLPVQAVVPLKPSVHPTRAGSYVPAFLNGAPYAPNSAPPASAGARVEMFGPGPSASKPLPKISGPGSHRPSPLFPSSAPRNARPSTTDQTLLYGRKATHLEEPRVDDSSPQRGSAGPQFASETRSDDADRRYNPTRRSELPSVAEFSESVFIGPRGTNSPHTRETVEPALPGAFRFERDAPHLESSGFAHSPPTPPTRLRSTKSRKTESTSVPGGFDDVASGEEDNVPPLPEVSPVKRSSRRRASRASSVDGEEDSAPVKPRRSSRLSQASSSPEPSPQKISAPKATRKTRASAGSSATTGVATATRSSTRKKR
jgi:hypothetical protein